MIVKAVIALVIVGAVVVGLFAAADWNWDLALMEAWIQQHALIGAAAYIGIFVLSTLLPITSLPLLPLAARVYGVGLTFLLSTTGWWLGCILAFQVGRWGLPHFEKLASTKLLERCERLVTRKHSFSAIVMLRMLFPGDLVGFTLGLIRQVSFSMFATAALLGTIPHAIVASFAGGEFGHGRYWNAALLVIAMFAAMLLVRRMWERRIGAAPHSVSRSSNEASKLRV